LPRAARREHGRGGVAAVRQGPRRWRAVTQSRSPPPFSGAMTHGVGPKELPGPVRCGVLGGRALVRRGRDAPPVDQGHLAEVAIINLFSRASRPGAPRRGAVARSGSAWPQRDIRESRGAPQKRVADGEAGPRGVLSRSRSGLTRHGPRCASSRLRATPRLVAAENWWHGMMFGVLQSPAVMAPRPRATRARSRGDVGDVVVEQGLDGHVGAEGLMPREGAPCPCPLQRASPIDGDVGRVGRVLGCSHAGVSWREKPSDRPLECGAAENGYNRLPTVGCGLPGKRHTRWLCEARAGDEPWWR